MNNQLKKRILLAGIVCMFSFSIYGCGNSQETSINVDESQEADSEVNVSGKILKLDDMQFTMKDYGKVVKEDGTIESKGNGHKVTVLYDEDCIFYIRTIQDDGMSYEDTEAAAADMAENMDVEITGYYEGKKLHAVQVQIIKYA